MVRFLVPREARFFDLFEKDVANLVVAANTLAELLENYEDVPAKVKKIIDLEHEGDAITHQITEQLHRTFVTPLDREDIALLAYRMDDIMDFIQGAAEAMLIYKISRPTRRAQELAAIIVKVVDELNKAIPRLRHRGQMKQILEHCIEVNRLENEADDVLRVALSELFELFNDVKDVVEIIKWREIYEQLESATDRGEDVANVLEGVIIKYA